MQRMVPITFTDDQTEFLQALLEEQLKAQRKALKSSKPGNETKAVRRRFDYVDVLLKIVNKALAE